MSYIIVPNDGIAVVLNPKDVVSIIRHCARITRVKHAIYEITAYDLPHNPLFNQHHIWAVSALPSHAGQRTHNLSVVPRQDSAFLGSTGIYLNLHLLKVDKPQVRMLLATNQYVNLDTLPFME